MFLIRYVSAAGLYSLPEFASFFFFSLFFCWWSPQKSLSLSVK